MNHEEKAQALFLEGCNCAQAVFAAFCDVTGFSRHAVGLLLWRRCGADAGDLRRSVRGFFGHGLAVRL